MRNFAALPAMVALMMLGGSVAAVAQQENPGDEQEWDVMLGGIGLLHPAYEGSDDFWLRGYPAADITYRDRFFLDGRHGLGAYVVNTDAARLGLSVFYARGRDENDSRDLAGTGDIDGGADLNAFAEYSVGPYGLSLEANHQITGDATGTRVELGASYSRWIGGRRALINPGVWVTGASGRYMDAYFSITAEQAAVSGYPQYEAGAGTKSVRLDTTVLLFPTEKWLAVAIPTLGYLIGDAAASPLVRRKLQPGILLALLYRF